MCFILKKLVGKGYKSELFCYAGEVGIILSYTYKNTIIEELKVLALIDDHKKIHNKLFDTKIISSKDINDYAYDGVLISNYGSKKKMRNKLLDFEVDRNIIIEYFS